MPGPPARIPAHLRSARTPPLELFACAHGSDMSYQPVVTSSPTESQASSFDSDPAVRLALTSSRAFRPDNAPGRATRGVRRVRLDAGRSLLLACSPVPRPSLRPLPIAAPPLDPGIAAPRWPTVIEVKRSRAPRAPGPGPRSNPRRSRRPPESPPALPSPPYSQPPRPRHPRRFAGDDAAICLCRAGDRRAVVRRGRALEPSRRPRPRRSVQLQVASASGVGFGSASGGTSGQLGPPATLMVEGGVPGPQHFLFAANSAKARRGGPVKANRERRRRVPRFEEGSDDRRHAAVRQ